MLRFADDSLRPIAGVLLVVGAGGGFGRVLSPPGADSAITHVVGRLHLSPLVLGYVIAALLRLSVGSATVAFITTATLMAPTGAVAGATPTRTCWSLRSARARVIASHVNDGGFWLVKEYFNMSVRGDRRHLDAARDHPVRDGARRASCCSALVVG